MSLEEEDDDAPMVIEEEVDAPPSKKKPAAAPKKKPTAAPKKKPTAPAKKPAAAAPKKRDRSEDEEEEEEEEPAEKHAAVAEEAAAEKPKKERVKHKPRARGDRLASAPVYRTHLNKDRQRRKEKAIKDGKEPPASRRSKPGASVAREIEFLNKANGLYLTTALTRRLAIDAIGKVVPVIRAEYAHIKERLERRGKNVPAAIATVSDAWSIGPGAVQLLRAAIDMHLEVTADAAFDFKTHAKRKTVKRVDIVRADEFLEKHAAK